MSTNTDTIDMLNDLILINNDRVAGYEKAYEETNESDLDLRSLFTNLAKHSKQHVSELTGEVDKLGGTPATGTMTSGKLYRAWMDVKATFSSNERQAALENSEFGEDAAQKAYKEALKSDELATDLRTLIIRQQATLKSGHDTIKLRRDAEKAAAQ